MNIFILDKSIDEAVRFHCDKHVGKNAIGNRADALHDQWTLSNTALQTSK